VYRCIEACAEFRGLDSLSGLSIAVQGCGDIGSAVGRKLAAQGMQILLADIDAERAQSLALEIDGKVVPPDLIFASDVDIIAPCARGRVITPALAQEISAWAICGGANNILQHDDLEDILREQNILFVPDVLSSSGAVIAGMSREVMGLTDHAYLIAAIGKLTSQILREANDNGGRTTAITERFAKDRIAKAGQDLP
jgi:leucine dehydrogenase